jgi:uncharacterized repeat protein (TIGR04138 family)
MQTISFEEALDRLLVKETRYRRDAYLFVRDALDHTRKLLDREHKEARPERRGPHVEQHVTGQQLLAGARALALETYGPMAITVLEEWGVRSCPDIGEIVFIMVENQLLKKTEKDSRADFAHGYDFFEAFRQPYLPRGRSATAAQAAKEAKA